MQLQPYSALKRRSSRLDTAPMASAVTTPKLRNEPSADDPSDFMHAESVHLDSKTSQYITDDVCPAQPATSAKLDSDNPVPATYQKPQKSRREERQLRLAAEQAVWLRSKFDLPPSEQLITSFSAALFRHILLQGRMYITTTTICFYTRIFGKVTKDLFPFSAFSHVKKRRGGLVANAIKIYFLDQTLSPVVIGSLNHREKAFDTIQTRLRHINPAAAEPKETVHDDDGSAASLGSANADSEEPFPDPNDLQNGHRHPTQPTLMSRPSALMLNPSGQTTNIVPTDPQLTNQRSRDFGSSASLSQENSSHSLASHDNHSESEPHLVWQTSADVIGRVAANAFPKKSERTRGILNAPVKTVFNLLFISDWLKQYHEAVSNRDVVFTEWCRGEDGFMSRDVNFRRPIGYKIGPKETRVREKHRYSFTEDGGVIVELSTESLDAPYGNSFVCETFYELNPHNDGSQTLLIASVAVHFVKDLWTMLQGKIESSALAETKKTCQRLLDLATGRIHEHVAEVHIERKSSEVNLNDQERIDVVRSVPRSQDQYRNPSSRKQRISQNEACNTNGSSAIVGTIANHRHDRRSRKVNLEQAMPPAMVQPQGQGMGSGGEEVDCGDLNVSKWVALAVVTLIIVCVVLVAVLMLLNRLQHSVHMLEGIVANKYVDVEGDICRNTQTC